MIGEEKSPVSLATLSPKKQLAFALLVFERMLPSLIGGWLGLGKCRQSARCASKLAIKPDTAFLFMPEKNNLGCLQSLHEPCGNRGVLGSLSAAIIERSNSRSSKKRPPAVRVIYNDVKQFF
jgi:hypothetical protein